VLVPRARKCVNLHGKRDSEDVIKNMNLGDYPGLSSGTSPSCSQRVKRNMTIKVKKGVED
jgi:hypothetical protein